MHINSTQELQATDPIRFHIIKALEESLEKLLGTSETYTDMLAKMISVPPEPAMGDYALPCFPFAKLLRKKPELIAEELKATLNSEWIEKMEVVGAYLNFFIDKNKRTAFLLPSIENDSYFANIRSSWKNSDRIMVEYSQPNTHKEFHVGHVRNVCLGNALCRIFSYLGQDIIGANYIGDEGTHVAKCLWQIGRQDEKEPENAGSEWYGQCYVKANKALEEADEQQKEEFKKQISHVLKELESKKGPYYTLWEKTRTQCLSDFDKIYKWLDVKFDHIFYESELTDAAQDIVDEYVKKGLFTESKGAIGIDMEPYGLGYFMARKSDGTKLYMTLDLALAKKKFKEFAISSSIYVVGSEQNFHFRQLFKALELMGFAEAKNCYHLSYAHVKLPEGKISSRKGNAFTFRRLTEILTEEIKQYMTKYKDSWSEQEIDDTVYLLAMGAIKYGMITSDPSKEIVFDAQAWTSFEGFSGPYLMYGYARGKSVLAKAKEKDLTPAYDTFQLLSSPLEQDLLRSIYDFNGVCVAAAKTYKPSQIAHHLCHMVKEFNRFYAELPVLKGDDQKLTTARLALVASFTKTLKQGLHLLGITPPERM